MRLPQPYPPPVTSVPQPAPPIVTRPQPPAVVALLETAEQQANSGDLEAAAASLERAIRIDPRNPLLWHHLATVRLSQGDAQAAEQLAVKSNSLASGNTRAAIAQLGTDRAGATCPARRTGRRGGRAARARAGGAVMVRDVMCET